MARRRTRGEVELEARLGKLEPGTPRYNVLLAARDFRTSWIELGERLTEVSEKRQHEQWGYPSLEAYCRRELRLRRDTVAKLTRSYSFLRDHQPKALKEQPAREVPPLDVVDLLTQARERTKVSDSDFRDIQNEVFTPEGPATRSQVVQRFREVDPDAFRGQPRQTKEAEGSKLEVRKALLLAERLGTLLEADEQTSGRAKSAMGTVVAELRQRFAATQLKSA